MRIVFRLAVCILLPTLVSCRSDREKPGTPVVECVDDLQRTVQLFKEPRRIVSLAPSITEILFAVGADSTVVGVTDICDYPAAAQTRTRMGSIRNPSIEAIAGMTPDLVIMTIEGNTEHTFKKLTDLDIPVFVTNPRTVAGVMKSILDIGQLMHRNTAAHRIVDSMSNLIREIQSVPATADSRVMMLVAIEPLMVVGSGTFLDELIRMAGGTNIAAGASGAYPTLSREEVVRQNPDIILIPTDIRLPIADLLRKYPEWRTVKAVRNGNLFFVDANLLQRPGPRIISALRILRDLFLTHFAEQSSLLIPSFQRIHHIRIDL